MIDEHVAAIREALGALHRGLDAACEDGLTFFAATENDGNDDAPPRFSITAEKRI